MVCNSKYAPPVSGLGQRDIPNPDVGAANKPNEPGPALVTRASPGAVPARHHVLLLVEPLHESRALTVHHPTSGDPHIAGVLCQHHVPPRLLLRVVVDPRAAEDPRTLLDVQHDAGLKSDGGGEVGPRRKGDAAGGVGGAGVDRRLDGVGIVLNTVAGGAEVGDGDGDREWGQAEDGTR